MKRWEDYARINHHASLRSSKIDRMKQEIKISPSRT
jgi:hypothetical protein